MFSSEYNYFLFPFFQAAAGLSLGIVFASFFTMINTLFYFIWFLIFFSFLFCLILKKIKISFFSSLVLQTILFFFAGGFIWSLHTTILADGINSIKIQKTLLASVENITFSPRSKHYKYLITLRIFESSILLEGWSINLYLRKNFLAIGEQISLNNFNFLEGRNYDICNNSLGSIFYQPQETKIYKLRTKNLSLKNYLMIAKLQLSEKILKKLSPKTQSFFGQLFLGKKQKELSVELREIFNNWGVSHYLARSGLHLTVFSYLLAMLFLIFPIPLFLRYFCLIFISLFYYFMTFPSVSFLRAELMFLLFLGAKIFNREINQLHFLSLTYLCLLLFNPFLLFALDFELTFSLVLGLLLVGKFNL